MDINHRRRELHFLMPFIDFAFMVIIIFVGLLSMAYFDPPGSAGVKRQKSVFTENNIKELAKMGLTPTQIKELVVIRNTRQKKLQDTQARVKIQTGMLKKVFAETGFGKKSAPRREERGRFNNNQKNKDGEKPLLKENLLLEKKVALLEKQLEQTKKQAALLKLLNKKLSFSGVTKKTNAAHVTDTNGKDNFGGHEFVDLRK